MGDILGDLRGFPPSQPRERSAEDQHPVSIIQSANAYSRPRFMAADGKSHNVVHQDVVPQARNQPGKERRVRFKVSSGALGQ